MYATLKGDLPHSTPINLTCLIAGVFKLQVSSQLSHVFESLYILITFLILLVPLISIILEDR